MNRIEMMEATNQMMEAKIEQDTKNLEESRMIRLTEENKKAMKYELNKMKQTLDKAASTTASASDCGYRELAFTVKDIIFWDNITTPLPSNLNKYPGTYIAPFSGTYIATYSMYASERAGEHMLSLSLRNNGTVIPESKHISKYGGSSGLMDDQGGRTLIT